jgi:hypothetical protein
MLSTPLICASPRPKEERRSLCREMAQLFDWLTMWSQGRSCSRHSRVVPFAVAWLQLATVTWLPVIHPIIHPDEPPPYTAESVTQPGHDQDPVSCVATFCFICGAGQEFSAATDHTFSVGHVTSWQLPLNCAEPRTSPLSDSPANAARAPPSY